MIELINEQIPFLSISHLLSVRKVEVENVVSLKDEVTVFEKNPGINVLLVRENEVSILVSISKMMINQ